MLADVRRLHPMPSRRSRVPLVPRLLGLGSVFGKSLRDARRAMLVVVGLLACIIGAGGAAMASTYGTLEARADLLMLSSTMPPMIRGLYGNPVNVGTLGGFVSWHYGAYLALVGGLWSILALSSTLAAEAARGSLDLTVSTPQSRRAIALQKAAAHVTAMGIAVAIIATVTWATGVAFARLPGDEIAPGAAIAFAVGFGIRSLIAGSISFALAPLVGRGAAAGLAGAAVVGSYVLQSYRAVVPAFDGPASLGWYSWTSGHIPLAGPTDWPAIAATALVAVGFLAIGVEVFARRDIGVTISVPAPGWPAAILGVRGVVRRSLGDLLPTSAAWGVGLGLYGFVMAASARGFAEAIASSPDLADVVRGMIPGIDLTTSAGFLQMAFADFGFVLVGLAAVNLLALRASDETSGRLELQLSAPLTRIRWAASSGVAAWVAMALLTLVLAAAVAGGVALAGEDPAGPVAGTIELALYGAAMLGLGAAVGGLGRPGLAVPVVLAVVILTFLVDTLAPALNPPDWVEQLALTSHLGRPMIGTWDWVGVVACVTIAVGGLAAGAWGMGRRDING